MHPVYTPAVADSGGPQVNPGPHISESEEVTGDEVGTNVFPILFCTYRYPRFARRITRASSLVSMAAR